MTKNITNTGREAGDLEPTRRGVACTASDHPKSGCPATEFVPNLPTDLGRKLGKQLARITDIEVAKLIADGEWECDERCSSCAFRGGTLPNGCEETLMDAIKATVEGGDGKTFFGCHAPKPGDTGVCMGWFAAGQRLKGPVKVPWGFAPIPDEENAHAQTSPKPTKK